MGMQTVLASDVQCRLCGLAEDNVAPTVVLRCWDTKQRWLGAAGGPVLGSLEPRGPPQALWKADPSTRGRREGCRSGRLFWTPGGCRPTGCAGETQAMLRTKTSGQKGAMVSNLGDDGENVSQWVTGWRAMQRTESRRREGAESR